MADQRRLRLALDHNFPTPILAVLERYLPDLDLVPIKAIDHRMPDLGDRELILALHQAGWPVLVTSNHKMLRNPKELAAILRTKLTVVAIEGVGDDMLRATGALLLDLPGIVKRLRPDAAQIFHLRPRDPRPNDAWDYFTRAATHAGREAPDLYDEVKVTDTELTSPVL